LKDKVDRLPIREIPYIKYGFTGFGMDLLGAGMSLSRIWNTRLPELER